LLGFSAVAALARLTAKPGTREAKHLAVMHRGGVTFAGKAF
jgi:hypothetical protein